MQLEGQQIITRIYLLEIPESIHRQLEIRLKQMDSACILELWQEAYRSIEDFQALVQMTTRSLKASLMRRFYEKLTTVFWAHEHYFFYSYAHLRLFQLRMLPQKKKANNDEIQKMATHIILGALCMLPPRSDDTMASGPSETEQEKDRVKLLGQILGFTNIPTQE
ncbi:MAG: putative Eukaryotic translation initiation factor 3 subunit A, partial [Streblomastix strix]